MIFVLSLVVVLLAIAIGFHYASKLDPDDPLASVVTRTKTWFQRLSILTVGLFAAVVVFGVPHIQTTYSYQQFSRYDDPSTRHKTEANYFGPFGWKRIGRYEYGEDLSLVFCIPLDACIDFSEHAGQFPFSLLPPEYLDGRTAN
ncbi:hypothetical protein [Rhodopirellula bahusiensis]|uniref:hypothetical protein n=1 Tax=Rhodopirellula bahusiensis TaxID=2014065 RepID=UPI0032668A2B